MGLAEAKPKAEINIASLVVPTEQIGGPSGQ